MCIKVAMDYNWDHRVKVYTELKKRTVIDSFQAVSVKYKMLTTESSYEKSSGLLILFLCLSFYNVRAGP